MRLLVLVFLLSGCSIHAENDLFIPFHKTKDKYFTHGSKFTHIEEKEEGSNGRDLYSIGQNIYTPSKKTGPEEGEDILDDLARDRPYSGWLYGEYRRSYRDRSNNIETYGLQLGCVGPCSFARFSQQTVHRALGQKIPTWRSDFQQKSEPGVILEYELGKVFKEEKYYDFSGGIEFKGGNIITDGKGTLSFRAGTGLEVFHPEPIIFRNPSDSPLPHDSNRVPEKDAIFNLYGFLETEVRGVLYNHLLSGSLFQSETHRVREEPFIAEGRAGFSIGYGKLKFTYTFFALTNEWKERKGGFAFGGLDFTWN